MFTVSSHLKYVYSNFPHFEKIHKCSTVHLVENVKTILKLNS